MHIPEHAKASIDTAALIAMLSGWLGVLSTGLTIVSTLVGLVWLCIRICETRTVRAWRRRRKRRG